MKIVVNAYGANPELASTNQAAIAALMAEHERPAGHEPRLPRGGHDAGRYRHNTARRFHDPDIMAALVAAVAAEPGLRPSHYARIVGVSYGSAQQRLKLLAEHGCVRREKRGRDPLSPAHYWPVEDER